MKKLALLFIILCASALYGMKRPAGEHYVGLGIESELKPEIWGQVQLPDDVKTLIMVALSQSGDNLDEVINNIKKVSVINKELNATINGDDLKNFTKLVHILTNKYTRTVAEVAKKHKVSEEMISNLMNTLSPGEFLPEFQLTTEEVAQKINTPIAKKYIELGNKLMDATYMLKEHWPFDKITQLIQDGADVNFVRHDDITPFLQTIQGLNPEGAEFLLNAGAKPSQREIKHNEMLLNDYDEAKTIKTLFDNAK